MSTENNSYNYSHPNQNNYPGNYSQPNYQQTSFQQAPTYDAYGNQIAPDAKTISLFSHLSSLVLYLLTASTLSFIGPLIFWLIYKSRPGYAFVTANSARAFNFNFTMWIINAVAWIISIITLGLGFFITLPVWAITTVLVFIFHVIGAVKANKGEVYNYPMQIRVLKD